ncbi:polysaccharide ABC transporter ATP-binding protein [Salinimicrobium sp. GXAS 041]|uniref:ABC transporter ATP-binding protein n=1 Tax=Salinimicrobium sp. GXAS 041 TaxID=3400806 RepID=UPI003C778EEF
MSVILKAENISKQYRLGTVGTGTLSHDLNRWWHQVRGKEDPYLKVGASNDSSAKATEDYVWALRDINFEVKQGEVLGIIGKNGAGKSTLLKILSRVTGPTTGSIKTKGRIASLLEVGTGFHGELTGRENIFMNGAVLGMTKAEIKSKLDEIIAFSGCERYIDTPVKRYSSGMTVRLGFAVAAHLEPEILVVDEVLAVGDAEFQKKAIGKMQDLSAGEGRTVLFVSHNMASVSSLCSCGIVLEDGQTVFRGGVRDSIGFYLNNKNHYLKEINFYDLDKQKGICKVEFLGKDNVPANVVVVGQEVRIKMGYKNPGGSNTVLSIAFYDYHENFLFACRSDVVNKKYSPNCGEGLLVIHKWPLSTGIYTYNTGMLEANIMIENLKDVGRLTVENGDFYGSGKLPAPSKRGFYTNFEWL